MIGSTPGIRAVRDRIERLAATDFTVLIEGRKRHRQEAVARQIHDLVARREARSSPSTVAAIVETLLEAELFGIEDRTATGVRGRRGKFEHADRNAVPRRGLGPVPVGSGEAPRAIQELSVERVGGQRDVDTRIIAATNSKLSQLVAAAHSVSTCSTGYGGSRWTYRRCANASDILELAQYFLERHRDYAPGDSRQTPPTPWSPIAGLATSASSNGVIERHASRVATGRAPGTRSAARTAGG